MAGRLGLRQALKPDACGERIAAVPSSGCRTLGRLRGLSLPPLSNGGTMVCTSSDHCEDGVSKNTQKRGRASGP